MRVVSRAILLMAGLLAGDPRRLAAQTIDRGAAGAHARVEACEAAGDRASYQRFGQLHSHDDATVVLDGRDGRDSIPTSRVLRLELRMKRSRELEGAGALLGIFAGPLAMGLVPDKSDGQGTGVMILVGAVVGGIVGYRTGGRLSGEEEWAPLPLPPGHGSACIASTGAPTGT